MATTKWNTPRKTDSAVLKSIVEIAPHIAPGQPWNLQVYLAEGHQPLTLPLGAPSEELQALLAMNDACATQIVAAGGHFTLRLKRPLTQSLDDAEIEANNKVEFGLMATALQKARQEFPRFAHIESVEKLLGPELAEFYRSRDTALLKLESASQQLIEDTARYRNKLDTETDALRTRLTAETSQLREQQQHEARAKAEELETQRSELDAKAKTLDDRASRHARRELRVALQTELSNRNTKFTLTESTSKKRRIVHALFGGLLLLAGAILVFTIGESYGAAKDLAYILRIGLSVLGLATTALLYIRWNDQWFRQHADEEFRLKRMSLDIDRASWIVEMAMEWQQHNNGEIPALLLAELSRDLFTTGQPQAPLRHPAEDALSALLSVSSNLKLNLPGGIGEMVVERKGLQQLQKPVSDGSSTN